MTVNICLQVGSSWRWSRIFRGALCEVWWNKMLRIPASVTCYFNLKRTWVWDFILHPSVNQASAAFRKETRRMVFALHVIVMSSAFFNPSFAFSSHFDTGKVQTDKCVFSPHLLQIWLWLWCFSRSVMSVGEIWICVMQSHETVAILLYTYFPSVVIIFITTTVSLKLKR